MKKSTWKKISSTLLSTALLSGCFLSSQSINRAVASEITPEVTSTTIPEANTTYTSAQTTPIVLSESSSVKLSGVNISVPESSENTSAIKICGSSNVNLILEGANVLSGNANLIGAGIYVEEGSSVTIYGLENSSLNVTGGKYSAGIGGIGYTGATVTNPTAGEINIKSGNITAVGGARGAGIGSGYHSSASSVNIFGGCIKAIGSECGAGIGTGYGTSGGAFVDASGNPTASGVGFYNAGNITISGGDVKAASYNIDFARLDPCDIQTLYTDAQGNAYSTGSFAAGIGGGYGASSGNIVINGSAEVTAVGGCGGAGIGSGRGTSKVANYDANHFFSNITIGGNSKVIAMATDDTRNSQGGGAAIGTGRGCSTAGTIKILDSANVTAVASPYTAAIGGSWKVGSLPFTSGVLNANASEMFALPTNLEISSSSTVSAVSDGSRSAVSMPENIENALVGSLLSLNFDSSFFENRSDYFTADKFPVTIDANGGTSFALYNSQKSNAMVNVPTSSHYYLKVKNSNIYLSNSVEPNSADFVAANSGIKDYSVTGLTEAIDVASQINYNSSSVNVKFQSPKGVFNYGSAAQIQNVTDETSVSSQLDAKYADTINHILYANISVNNYDGNLCETFPANGTKIYIQISSGWNKEKVEALYLTETEDTSFAQSQTIETIDGADYVVFDANKSGNYALIESKPTEVAPPTEEPTEPAQDDGLTEITIRIRANLEKLKQFLADILSQLNAIR